MSDTPDRYHVAIIGGGPGGYVAAVRASQLGLRTVCVEKEALGGVCLNWGCIPSKALLTNARVYRQVARDAKKWGLRVEGLSVDWPAVIQRSRKVAKRLERGVRALFKKYGVEHVAGTATLERPGVVQVGERTLVADHVIVATGARARALPGLPFDGDRIMSYREAMVVPERPDRVLVIGAGAIGCEFAWFFNAFGCETTLVEVAPRIVLAEDEEVSAALEASLHKQGIRVHTGAVAEGFVVSPDGVRAQVRAVDADGPGEAIEVDRVLVAVGVAANVEGLGLEGCGVELERGVIRVDGDSRTTCPGIYAIGDVTGPPALAHKASAEGVHCVERIAGHPGKPVDRGNIATCTYCEPQVASVGLTEAQARAAGHELRVGRFPFQASGKALAVGESEGFAKVVLDAETGELLGAHLIGHGVTELITEAALARTLEATEAEILGTIHPHPTLSEALQEAVGHAMGESVNF